MYNRGEEIILESFKIPWLIWIQLFILFLLILLLSYLDHFSLDLPPSGSSSTSTESSAGVEQDALSCSQELIPEAQEQIAVAGDRERNTEGNASSMKDLQRLFHPCYYFELARQAFLQCLGLSFASPNPRERGHDE
ncbi:hypothetical protein V2J09_002034 [Rumex salicifolius]